MSDRIKRGLGLLVVAVIALLVGLAASQGDSPNAVSALAGLTMVVAGAVGLGNIAWGLLRE